MQIKKKVIMGMLVFTGLIVQSAGAYALYSPKIAQQVAIIKQHVNQSQAQNGTGDIFETVKTIQTYNRAKRDAFDETGFSGEARVAQELVRKSYEQVLQNPLDSLMMVFNYNGYNQQFISNCLRDEIWSLEKLRDVVGAEMVRAYLLFDTVHGKLLEEDYVYIITQLDLLRKYGSDPYAEIPATNKDGEDIVITSNQYFFNTDPDGPDSMNYYTRKYFKSDQTGCPDGEFEQVFERVANSWKSLSKLSSGKGVQWGSIWSMAQANARIKARQWIKANQLSLSLGGETGANLQSLVQGHGWDQFVGDFKTNLNILKNMAGPVTPLFDRSIWKRHTAAVQDGVKVDCVYYNAEAHLFITCNPDQIEQYKSCKSDETVAETTGIRCDRYKTINEARSLAGLANSQVVAQREHEEKKAEAERAFTYAINLDSVAEQTIKDVDGILLWMNGEIELGYKEGIPSLTKEVLFLSVNQCANKQ